ncbi:hypothetical protein ACWEO2_33380 [Nocardia sp. NPDC004278]
MTMPSRTRHPNSAPERRAELVELPTRPRGFGSASRKGAMESVLSRSMMYLRPGVLGGGQTPPQDPGVEFVASTFDFPDASELLVALL